MESKPTVWRWQQRYLDEGVAGLKRDKTRPSRVPPLPMETRTWPERAVTSWLAFALRLFFGGVQYRTTRLNHAATPPKVLQERVQSQLANHARREPADPTAHVRGRCNTAGRG